MFEIYWVEKFIKSEGSPTNLFHNSNPGLHIFSYVIKSA